MKMEKANKNKGRGGKKKQKIRREKKRKSNKNAGRANTTRDQPRLGRLDWKNVRVDTKESKRRQQGLAKESSLGEKGLTAEFEKNSRSEHERLDHERQGFLRGKKKKVVQKQAGKKSSTSKSRGTGKNSDG